MGEIRPVAKGGKGGEVMKCSVWILWLPWLVFLPCLVKAQQITIRGIVYESQRRETLVGANIIFQSDPGVGTISAESGQFSLTFDVGHRRNDTLVVTYIGFRKKYIPVDLSADTSLEIFLQAESSAFDVIEVKAEGLIAREFSTSRIRKLDIYTNPAAKADPLLAVQSLPAETSTEETANISLRGSSPAETTILLNNIPVKDAVKLDQANGVGQFSIFNTSMIESATVFTSNPPLDFSAATSGIVALQTDDKIGANTNSLSLTFAGLGFYANRNLGKNADLAFYGNWSKDDILKGLNPHSLRNIQRFSTIDGGIYLSKRFRSGAKLKFFSYILKENYGYALREPTFEGTFKQQKIKNLSILNVEIPLKKGRLQYNQGFHISRGEYRAANLDNEITNTDHYLDLNYAYAADKWNLKAGIAYRRDYYRLEAVFPQFPHAFGDGYPAFSFEDEDQLKLPEVFLYGKYYINTCLIVGIGSRYHPAAFDRTAYLSRQLNLTYQPSEKHKFILSGGRYYKYVQPGLDFTQTTLIQSSHQALDYQFSNDLISVNAAIYRKRSHWDETENLIDGAEIFVALNLPRLKTGISVASVNSILKTGDGEYPSPHDLGHYFRMLVKYDIPGWFEMNAVLRHRQGKYYLPLSGVSFDEFTQTYSPFYRATTEGDRLPDYRGFDLGLSRLIPLKFGGLIVFASVNNVLDFKNVRRYNYNFDYSSRQEEYYNRRVFFGGVVLSF